MKPSSIAVGAKFGRLTVQDIVRRGRKTFCKCQCSCGSIKQVRADHLTRGRILSCGCLRAELSGSRNRTHGMSHATEYVCWSRMIDRCTNVNSKDYALYGGRGISVCESWLSFSGFIADMGQRPSSDHSIERVRNDGNYEPGNCRWATRKEQARNKRSTRFITAFGQRMSLSEWAEKLCMSADLIRSRIDVLGLEPEVAMTMKKYSRRRSSADWGL